MIKTQSFLPIEKLIKMAVNKGFKGISLRPSVVSSSTPKQNVLKIKDIFNLNKMVVSMITSNINLAKNDNDAANRFKKYNTMFGVSALATVTVLSV